MNNPVVKALDSNFMEMMTAHIGKTITSAYVEDEVKSLNDLLAKKQKIEDLEAALEKERVRKSELEAENAGLKERVAAMEREAQADKSIRTELAAVKESCALVKAECIALKSMCDMMMQASESVDSTEVEKEQDDPTGAEITVVRGGDDRVRSLVVRYTK